MAGTLTLPRRSSADRRTVRAAAVIVMAGIAVKLVATCKESAVAGFYGRSDAMDAFLAALLIPNLLINVIAESMNQALIPTLIRVRLGEGLERARQLLASAMTALCLLLAGVAAVMALLAPVFFRLIASNFAPSKLGLSIHLFYALLPCVVLGGLASSCTAVLNAADRFAVPALVPAIVPLAIIAGAFAFHGSAGIWALAVATLLGMAAYAGWMAYSVRSCGYGFQLRWYGWTEPLEEIARQYAPALFGSIVASGGLLVDQAMAAMLPAGSVSSLVFAGRFVSVAVSLLAGAISSALAPYLSELVAVGNWPACRTALRVWGARTAMVSVPVAAALIAGSRLLVRLVLQHGAFGSRDTRAVAAVLAMYALQIPFFVVSRVPYRLIVAMRRMDLVFYCGAINLVLDIVLNLVLMRWMGVAGIALATSLWTVSTCAFLWFWALRLLSQRERHADTGARP
ncbi:MAG TPA: lipid II flippase MurJ [Terracidiphilus sp.]|jgi:putative peptidoglycan lipid II flippase|nr:lipid II flippase MurJ [Terracidiphilus sp.]